jgi:hypothetical protein
MRKGRCNLKKTFGFTTLNTVNDLRDPYSNDEYTNKFNPCRLVSDLLENARILIRESTNFCIKQI